MQEELSMDQDFIKKLHNILEVSLENEQFGVKELAEEAGISRSQLHRNLKSINGKSPSQFIREFRLEKAMFMLQNNVATASEIAYRVGFSSPTYFNTSFREYYGYPPGEVKFRNPLALEKSETEQIKQPINHDQDNAVISSIEKISSRQRLILLFSLGLLLIIAFSYYFYFNFNDKTGTKETESIINEKSIAIIPFENLSDDRADEYFTKGVMVSVQNHLNKIKGLKVISEKSMEKYADTLMTASEISQEVGVTYLLDGTVQKYEDSIRIIIHFINAKDDMQLSSLVFNEEFNHLFAIQSNIAKQIAEELNITLTSKELEQIEKVPTHNLEAYNLYLKGRFFWHRRTDEDLKRSIHYFKQALELDSTYALAYAGLGDTYHIMAWHGWYPKNEAFNEGKKLTLKALSIDNNIAEAHATLGSILYAQEWKWEAAEKELKLAISLNPNYPTGHQYYSELLEILGNRKEAREQIDLALKLNPNSYIINSISASLYLKDGRYDKALIDATKAKEIDKNQSWTYWLLFEIYWNQGYNEKAIAEMEKWWNSDPNTIEMADAARDAYEKSGIRGIYKYLVDYDLENGYAHNQPNLMAQKYAFLEEKEKALEWLEISFEQRDLGMVTIKANPYFEILYNEPRFKTLLEKMGLEQPVSP